MSTDQKIVEKLEEVISLLKADKECDDCKECDCTNNDCTECEECDCGVEEVKEVKKCCKEKKCPLSAEAQKEMKEATKGCPIFAKGCPFTKGCPFKDTKVVVKEEFELEDKVDPAQSFLSFILFVIFLVLFLTSLAKIIRDLGRLC